MDTNVTISKQLKKATESLRDKMLILQTKNSELMNLKTKFVNETDPVRREKLKPLLIAKSKEVKAAEAEANSADATFQKFLSREPDEEMYDLLDHVINEDADVQEQIKKICIERLSQFFRIPASKLMKFKFDGTDDVREYTRALDATSYEGAEQYYKVAIKMAKEELGVHESSTANVVNEGAKTKFSIKEHLLRKAIRKFVQETISSLNKK